jgi:hypothetical protein
LFNLPLEGVPLTYAQQHIEGVLSQVAQQETVAPDTWAFWQDWFGLTGQPPLWSDASRQPANRCAHHWRQLLVHLSAIKPLILVLDNIDHADQASQTLLWELLHSGLLAEAPIALVLTKQAHTVWTGELAQAVTHGANSTTLAIAPLTEPEVVVFLDQGALAGQANHLPNALVQQLVHASQGLPLLLEEYLRYLTQQGLLVPDEGGSGALKPASYEGLGQVQLPASLPVLLQQRAHGLGDTARQLVQVASVLGERFAPSTLMGLCQLEEGPFQDALGQLWEQGWVVPDVANDLAFRHRSLAQYFYQGTPDSMREQLHQLVYQSLSAGYSEPTLLSPALLAHHAALGQLVPQWHAALHQAGLQAALVRSVVGANSCLLPLAHRLGAVPALADEYQTVLGQLVALNQTAQPELALAVMERMVAEAGPGCDTHTLRQLANLYEWNGRFTEANRTLTVALQASESGQHPALPVDQQVALALHFSDLLLQQGHIGQAHEVLEQRVKPLLTQAQTALPFEALVPLRVQAFLQQFQVALAHDVQQLPDAGQVAQANEWIAQTGDHHARLGLMLLQAKAASVAGQFGSAHQQLNEVLPLIEALPEPAYYLGQWGLIAAQCHVDRGDWTNASLIVPNTQVQAEAARDYNTVLMAQILEAVLLSQQPSHQAKADPLLDQVIRASDQVGLVAPKVRALRWKATGLLATHSQASEAVEVGQAGLDQAKAAGLTMEAFELVMVTGQALLQLGDVAAASALLKQYWPAMTASKHVPSIAQAAWLVAQLHYRSAAQVAPAGREHQMMQGKRYYERAVGLWHGLGNAYQRAKVEVAHRQTLIALEF